MTIFNCVAKWVLLDKFKLFINKKNNIMMNHLLFEKSKPTTHMYKTKSNPFLTRKLKRGKGRKENNINLFFALPNHMEN